jgi:hypothetical protein
LFGTTTDCISGLRGMCGLGDVETIPEGHYIILSRFDFEWRNTILSDSSDPRALKMLLTTLETVGRPYRDETLPSENTN